MKMAKKEKLSGTIEKTARNGKAFLIDEVWYSAYKASQMNGAEDGDFVEFEYEVVQKGSQTFYNVSGNVTVTKAERSAAPAGGGGGGGSSQRERHIIRQNVLSHATALVVAMPLGAIMDDVVSDVLEVAARLEEYVLGEAE